MRDDSREPDHRGNVQVVPGLGFWRPTMMITGLFAFVVLGCKAASVDSHKLAVAASVYPVYFFARQVGGDLADVINVTPAGTEPHDYEPTARDIARMDRARLVVLNGGGLETWGDKITTNLDPERTVVVTAAEGLLTQKVGIDGNAVMDPHVWLSPPLAQQMAGKIEQGFEQVDPANAPSYASNARALTSKLNDLDAAYRQGLAHCHSRDITTAHAAFGYLALTYHLNQVPIAGLSPDAEPSPKRLADIAEFAKKNHVEVIFFERLLSPRLSQTMATEIGARTMVLDPIEGMTKDDLATGKNYLTVMEQNLANLTTALQCTP